MLTKAVRHTITYRSIKPQFLLYVVQVDCDMTEWSEWQEPCVDRVQTRARTIVHSGKLNLVATCSDPVCSETPPVPSAISFCVISVTSNTVVVAGF